MTTTKPILVIYHDNCADGFASYMVARAKFNDTADYFACNYQNYHIGYSPADEDFVLGYKGNTVSLINRQRIIIADFSFKRMELNQLASVAVGTPSIEVWDHHKTAREELMQLEPGEPGLPEVWISHPELAPNVSVDFNMDMAGCWITWDKLFPADIMPSFVRLIGLRDIWKHKGTNAEQRCEALNMYIGKIGYDYDKWRKLWDDMFFDAQAIPQGTAILDFFNQKIDEACGHAYYKDYSFEGKTLRCAVVNAPYYMASELGSKLCSHVETKFAVIYSVQKDLSVIASLRSRDGTDVSAIAKPHGGGGHAAAAGCKFATFEWFAAAFL